MTAIPATAPQDSPTSTQPVVLGMTLPPLGGREQKEPRQAGARGQDPEKLTDADPEPEPGPEDEDEEEELGGEDRLHLREPSEVQGAGLHHEGEHHQEEPEQPDTVAERVPEQPQPQPQVVGRVLHPHPLQDARERVGQ